MQMFFVGHVNFFVYGERERERSERHERTPRVTRSARSQYSLGSMTTYPL